jgi:excisionase family DNA binding protein
MSRPRIRVIRRGRNRTITVVRQMPEATGQATPRLALSVKETAEALGLSKAFVERLIAIGELPSRKVGRRRLVPVAAIQAWLNEGEVRS